MADRPVTIPDLLAFQAEACGVVGSPLYQQILGGVLADHERGGVSARVLDERQHDPFGSALALRLLGAVHRIVLEGRAPGLAALYPSVGGDPSAGDPVSEFLAAMEAHQAEVERRLLHGVQTNEVARSAALIGGYVEVVRATGLPLRVLEVGASAGLNLRFDRYFYDTGESVAGDPESQVRFNGVWEQPVPLLGEVPVAERRGCDRNPIDPTTEDGRLSLLAFVWPDQIERQARLRAALALAQEVPVAVDEADAPGWVEAQLAEPRPGQATVVVHSIVMQYLSSADRQRFRDAVARAGAAATDAAPVAWLRMEPATEDSAGVRLTLWPGGEDRLLGLCGFHGPPVRWSAR